MKRKNNNSHWAMQNLVINSQEKNPLKIFTCGYRDIPAEEYYVTIQLNKDLPTPCFLGRGFGTENCLKWCMSGLQWVGTPFLRKLMCNGWGIPGLFCGGGCKSEPQWWERGTPFLGGYSLRRPAGGAECMWFSLKNFTKLVYECLWPGEKSKGFVWLGREILNFRLSNKI